MYESMASKFLFAVNQYVGVFMHSLLKIALLISICFVFAGCQLKAAADSIIATDKLSVVSGTVLHPDYDGKHSIVVLLVSQDSQTGQARAIITYNVLDGPDTFEFIAETGEYTIIAYEDLNNDFDYQKNEYIGWYPNPLKVVEGKSYTNLRILLQKEELVKTHYPSLYRQQPGALKAEFAYFALGDVVSLDDPRFSDTNGSMGLWSPYAFFDTVKSGVTFLEPYSPNKIPVLFVHGAGGHPGQWKTIAASLDRTKYQPWFLYYSSFFRLGMTNELVSKFITNLHDKYEFDEMYIVAHSMGGLVSRGTINALIHKGKADYIKLLVTISTPWGGHEMAGEGVDHSPVVIPSWFDVDPTSQYLKTLYNTELPDDLRFALFFGHKGEGAIVFSDSSDGTITLRSQLASQAQEAADTQWGFDEDHRSILNSDAVIKQLKRIFKEKER